MVVVKSELKRRGIIRNVQGIVQGSEIIGREKIIVDGEYRKLSWAIDKVSGQEASAKSGVVYAEIWECE